MPAAAPQRIDVTTHHRVVPVSTYFVAAMIASSISTAPGRCGLASWAMFTTTGMQT